MSFPGNELSLDNAAAFLLGDDKASGSPAGSNAAVDGEDADPGREDEEHGGEEGGDRAASAENSQDGADQAADGEQDTPADQGETNDGTADQGDDALPPIEPPSSWNAEEKAEWKNLSRKAQEAVQRREQENTRELRTLQNRSAEQNRTVEAEVTRLKGLASQVESVVTRDVAALAKDFPEIKSEADVAALAQSDPARFAEFQGRLMALNATAQAHANALAEVRKGEEAKEAEHRTKAKDALIEAFPTWKDPEVARREVTELQEYAIKQGVPEAAARANLDPFVFKLAQKAMLYDRAQAQKAKAVDRTPPRVVKQGSETNSRVTAKEDARRSSFEKYQKTGDLEDAAGMLLA